MAAPRALLLTLIVAGALGTSRELLAQSAPGALGTARACTRSRIGVVGSVTPVSAESHTFLGRFVGAFSRHVDPQAPRMRGQIEVGIGGSAPVSVAFSVKRPVSHALLPDQREDRLSAEQHRGLFADVKGALTEIRDVPRADHWISLRLEGQC